MYSPEAWEIDGALIEATDIIHKKVDRMAMEVLRSYSKDADLFWWPSGRRADRLVFALDVEQSKSFPFKHPEFSLRQVVRSNIDVEGDEWTDAEVERYALAFDRIARMIRAFGKRTRVKRAERCAFVEQAQQKRQATLSKAAP